MSLIARAKRYPKQKELGQNFLIDESKLDAIVLASDLDPERDLVIEIGPGIGFLTERIVDKCKKLYAVELDANAETSLKILKANHNNFDYIRKDFLSLSIDEIVEDGLLRPLRDTQGPRNDEMRLKVVANIPYQITTKILLHLLGEIGEENPNRKYLSEINILVQKEFADRLCAEPGTKAYGAITLLINYWAEVEQCVDVPAGAFWPPPKVDSCFIKIKLRDEEPFSVEKPKQLRRFIKAIFANRRKKLKNGLKAAGYQDNEIDLLDLDENLRGETLSLEEIVALVNKLSH